MQRSECLYKCDEKGEVQVWNTERVQKQVEAGCDNRERWKRIKRLIGRVHVHLAIEGKTFGVILPGRMGKSFRSEQRLEESVTVIHPSTLPLPKPSAPPPCWNGGVFARHMEKRLY